MIAGEWSTFISELHSAGDLPSECAAAFRAVPRERFIPDRVWVQQSPCGPYHPVDRRTEPHRWRCDVHSDRVIVTQFDDGATSWPCPGYRPTSSASMPSAVAGMLGALDVRPGHAVLEIGTGTGYNAALLAELTGAHGAVTTVEVDAAIARRARDRLDAAGYARVAVHVGDAVTAVPSGPFDRVIATASVRAGQLPLAWVHVTRPGGLILAPVRTDLTSGPLVRFRVREDGTARGRAMSTQVGFMEIRTHRVPQSGDPLPVPGERSTTSTSPFRALLDEDSRWAIAVGMPSCRYRLEEPTAERDHGIAWLSDPLSGSWARVAPDGDGYVVRQAGPRRLWDDAEAALRWWRERGEPPIESWVWLVTPTRQSVLLPDDAVDST